jgi:hypothetical protein
VWDCSDSWWQFPRADQDGSVIESRLGVAVGALHLLAAGELCQNLGVSTGRASKTGLGVHQPPPPGRRRLHLLLRRIVTTRAGEPNHGRPLNAEETERRARAPATGTPVVYCMVKGGRSRPGTLPRASRINGTAPATRRQPFDFADWITSQQPFAARPPDWRPVAASGRCPDHPRSPDEGPRKLVQRAGRAQRKTPGRARGPGVQGGRSRQLAALNGRGRLQHRPPGLRRTRDECRRARLHLRRPPHRQDPAGHLWGCGAVGRRPASTAAGGCGRRPIDTWLRQG